MAALQLTPKGNQYLRTDILYDQMKQNEIELALTDNVAALVTPKLILDGSGRAYLTGSIQLVDDTPITYKLFNLPKSLSMDKSSLCSVCRLSSGSYGNIGLLISSNNEGIGSVSLSDVGSFTSTPTIALNGPGEGAVLRPLYRITSAVLASNPTGTGDYKNGDIITLAGGVSTQAGAFTVTSIGVYDATVNAGGTGGTDGTQTVTGTTGTGTDFTASVTIVGGAITAVLSILTAGSYTVDPLFNCPVTGAGLSDASLNIRTMPLTFSVQTTGSYTTLPTNPVAQASSTGTGNGITLTVTFQFTNIGVLDSGTGYDSTSTVIFTGAGSAAATLVILSSDNQIYGKLNTAGLAGDIVSLDGIVFFVNAY